MPRHFRTKHKNEPEVLRINVITDKKQQEKEFHKLRLKGDFYHNLKVIECGGALKVMRWPPPDEMLDYKQFISCTSCLGFIQKHELWRHVKVCPFDEGAMYDPGIHNRKLQHESEMLLYGSRNICMEAMEHSVLGIMRNDDIFFWQRGMI